MVIDSHAHVIFPVEKELSLMQEAGIDKTILFVTSVHPEQATDLRSLQEEYHRLLKILSGANSVPDQRDRLTRVHHELRQVIKDNPTKFLGFGSAPVPLSREETADWVETQVVANQFCGLGEFSLQPGKMNDLTNVFAVAAEFGNLPIWVHTFHPCTLQDIQTLFQLARQYPTVPLIVGHMGGYHWLETIKMAKETPSVLLDVSAVFTVFAPKIAVAELPERTIFGSDAPYGDPLLGRQLIERITTDRYVADLVLGDTIAGVLKIHSTIK